MRVPESVVRERRERLAELLRRRQYLPVGELCDEFGVSEATARRDLAALSEANAITRTHGGAIFEFASRFVSFSERRARAAEGKRRVAAAALPLVSAGQTVFLDAGTTVFAVAEALAARGPRPLTVVTPSLPIAELLAGVEGIAMHLTGGQYLPRLSLTFGPRAVRALQGWRFDVALLGAEAVDATGAWNSQREVVALQRAAARVAGSIAVCADAGKLGCSAPEPMLPWRAVDTLVTDADPAALRRAGMALLPCAVATAP